MDIFNLIIDVYNGFLPAAIPVVMIWIMIDLEAMSKSATMARESTVGSTTHSDSNGNKDSGAFKVLKYNPDSRLWNIIGGDHG